VIPSSPKQEQFLFKTKPDNFASIETERVKTADAIFVRQKLPSSMRPRTQLRARQIAEPFNQNTLLIVKSLKLAKLRNKQLEIIKERDKLEGKRKKLVDTKIELENNNGALDENTYKLFHEFDQIRSKDQIKRDEQRLLNRVTEKHKCMEREWDKLGRVLALSKTTCPPHIPYYKLKYSLPQEIARGDPILRRSTAIGSTRDKKQSHRKVLSYQFL